jgi:predicted kinase
MKIELLIGMIASGKSTYAARRADAGALVVSHDALTAMLHGRYRYEADLKPAYLGMMLHIAWRGVTAGRDVVIDRTHLTRESRRIWVAAARERWGVPIVAVVFPRRSPEAHAIRRAAADLRGRSFEEWLHVARHHAGQVDAEPLDWEAEGFSAVAMQPEWGES